MKPSPSYEWPLCIAVHRAIFLLLQGHIAREHRYLSNTPFVLLALSPDLCIMKPSIHPRAIDVEDFKSTAIKTPS